MTQLSAVKQPEFTVRDIPFQTASLDIWATKYQLKDNQGNPVDQDIDATYRRVAHALADIEDQSVRSEKLREFAWALNNGAIPAGRIMSNLGANEHKPSTSTINCTVSDTITDSMDSILSKVHESGLTLKAGCGIGYEFSTLRPSGAFVAGAGASTSGPLSFMDIFDKTCFTVSSAGGRRGAQMATFDIQHPDVMEFIKAKREDGRFRQFNLSLLITNAFMDAVISDSDWPLVFPTTAKEVTLENLDTQSTEQVIWREWPVKEGYLTDDEGLVACKVYKTIKASKLWNLIMSSTYDFAEPGFILIDRVNEQNNNWYCENIRATNPCGEQPLPAYGACLLGSINLTKFVNNPFTEQASFDFERYRKVITIFTRMLDNVVEVNNLPLPQQQAEIMRKRRHGMGFLGLGSTLNMLGMAYGEEDSIGFTEQVSRELALAGWKAGVELAKEKGMAPIMDETFTITGELLRKRPELKDAGYQLGDHVKGRELHVYSRYMQTILAEMPELKDEILTHGVRFTHHSSIAPTGTISLSLANNASNGIEPAFSLQYSRNVIVEGKKSKEKIDVFSFEALAYRALISQTDQLPATFSTADNVTPSQHVAIQAAAQKWIDSSISKTVNVPTDIEFSDFQDLYLESVSKGLKGCTTFRFNPEVFQGVLVKEEDLENTTYEFTLEDGSTVSFKGNEEVEYDGETHTAANLFDALKEGYYGKL